MSDIFDLLEESASQGGSEAAFEFLVERFRQEKNYPLLFDALLMKKRDQLGLPLVWVQSFPDLNEVQRQDFERAYLVAAREVGELFLREGNIAGAWPYFQAIGEQKTIADAVEKCEFDSTEEAEAVIEIAFGQGVHPRRGFQLILEHRGLCRAISAFSQYPVQDGREECAALLVQQLYQDLVENLKIGIARTEEKEPKTNSLRSLISGRDWLFEGESYHIDTSHLASVVRFSMELFDGETLALAVELTEYGQKLSSMFQYEEHPPFEDGYKDYSIYLKALMGEEVDQAVKYFRDKVDELDLAEVGSYPAQVVVGLLSRLQRYEEAIEVSVDHLQEVHVSELGCPNLAQLCQLAGNYGKLMQLAREKSDLLEFTAGMLQRSTSQ